MTWLSPHHHSHFPFAYLTQICRFITMGWQRENNGKQILKPCVPCQHHKSNCWQRKKNHALQDEPPTAPKKDFIIYHPHVHLIYSLRNAFIHRSNLKQSNSRSSIAGSSTCGWSTGASYASSSCLGSVSCIVVIEPSLLNVIGNRRSKAVKIDKLHLADEYWANEQGKEDNKHYEVHHGESPNTSLAELRLLHRVYWWSDLTTKGKLARLHNRFAEKRLTLDGARRGEQNELCQLEELRWPEALGTGGRGRVWSHRQTCRAQWSYKDTRELVVRSSANPWNTIYQSRMRC